MPMSRLFALLCENGVAKKKGDRHATTIDTTTVRCNNMDGDADRHPDRRRAVVGALEHRDALRLESHVLYQEQSYADPPYQS